MGRHSGLGDSIGDSLAVDPEFQTFDEVVDYLIASREEQIRKREKGVNRPQLLLVAFPFSGWWGRRFRFFACYRHSSMAGNLSRHPGLGQSPGCCQGYGGSKAGYGDSGDSTGGLLGWCSPSNSLRQG